MSLIDRFRSVCSRRRVRNRRRRLALVAAASLVSLVLVVGQLTTLESAAPDGSIGELKARFVDVKGVKTCYCDEGQGTSCTGSTHKSSMPI